MAKAPAFDPKRIAASVSIDPLIVRTGGPLADGAHGAVVLLFDSRLEHDVSRVLHTIVIRPKASATASTGVFCGVIEVRKAQRDGVVDRFLIQYVDGQGEAAPAAETLAVVTMDFSRAPFTTPFQLLQEDQRDAVADAFCSALRDKVLAAFAEALWTEPREAAAEPLAEVARVPSPSVPRVSSAARFAVRRLPSISVPAGGGRLRWLGRGAAVASVLALMVWGATGFVGHKREPDLLAGIDPAVRAQLEAAGLRGSPTASPIPNVTEQTLRAMGLDPGKAASNLGCLARK